MNELVFAIALASIINSALLLLLISKVDKAVRYILRGIDQLLMKLD